MWSNCWSGIEPPGMADAPSTSSEPRRHYTPRYAQRRTISTAAWLKTQVKRGTLTTREVALDDNQKVQLYEAVGGYGTRTWESATTVSVSWLGTAANLAGLSVVEIGAGTGLCSLVLAVRGADVLATDHDAAALKLTAMSADASGCSHAVKTAAFDLLAIGQQLPACQLVVACDVIYSSALARALASRALQALDAGAKVLVIDPGRPTRREFCEGFAELSEGRHGSVKMLKISEIAQGLHTESVSTSFAAWAMSDSGCSPILLLHAEADELPSE